MGPELVPILVAAAGTAVTAVNDADANRRRKHILANVLQDQSKRKESIANETMTEAKNYTPANRAPQLAQAEGAANADYAKALTASDVPVSADAREGKLSNDFSTGLPGATAEAGSRSQRLASLLAKVRSSSDLRTNEAVRRGGVTEDVGSRLTDAQFAGQAGGQDAAGVRPDQFIDYLGKGMQLYGTFAGAGALTNAERMKTIAAMTAAQGGAKAVGPYTGAL